MMAEQLLIGLGGAGAREDGKYARSCSKSLHSSQFYGFTLTRRNPCGSRNRQEPVVVFGDAVAYFPVALSHR